MLTDGHHPDGFNQRVAGIPCVNNQTRLSKGSLGHCSSMKDNKQTLSTSTDPEGKSFQLHNEKH